MKNLLLTTAISAATLMGCAKDTPTEKTAAGEQLPVNIIQLTQNEINSFGVEFEAVETRALNESIVVPAYVIIDQDRIGNATTLVSGRIRSVHADFGDAVRKGQVLATIESVEFGQLIADALQKDAEAISATNEYERMKSLRGDDVTSEKLFQRAEAEYRSATAMAEGAKHKLSAAGMTDDEIAGLFKDPKSFKPYLNVRAPISGIVTERNATRGTVVHPDQILYTVINNAVVTVEGSVFQEDLPKLSTGMKAEFVSTAYPAKEFKGKIEEIGAALDHDSHTLPVWCSIPNSARDLRPNMNGELHIETGGQSEALSIPAEALIYDGNDTYVFLDKGNGALEYVQVQAGGTFGSLTAVTAGLNKGDRVANKGVFMLKSRFKLSQQEEE